MAATPFRDLRDVRLGAITRGETRLTASEAFQNCFKVWRSGINVVFAGNIGAGKSWHSRALLDQLYQTNWPGAALHEEDVDSMKNLGGVNPLREMYDENISTDAFQQILFNRQYMPPGMVKNAQYVHIWDNVPKLSTISWSKLGEKDMEAAQFNLIQDSRLEETCRQLHRHFTGSLVIVHYLHNTPESALANIGKRGRPEERDIDAEFLARVEECVEHSVYKAMPEAFSRVGAGPVIICESTGAGCTYTFTQSLRTTRPWHRMRDPLPVLGERDYLLAHQRPLYVADT